MNLIWYRFFQEAALNAETKQIVLVHGGGFGAWCWYKLLASFEEAGFSAHAIDLAGSGIDSTDPNRISSLELYVRPLILYLEKIPDTQKVCAVLSAFPLCCVFESCSVCCVLLFKPNDYDMQVMLVGHDFGGACISYVMERFPQKIAKSVFVSATMVVNGQSAFDVFSPEVRYLVVVDCVCVCVCTCMGHLLTDNNSTQTQNITCTVEGDVLCLCWVIFYVHRCYICYILLGLCAGGHSR